MTYLSLISVALLVLVHLLVGRMHFLERDTWRSVGAGVAMSYVFLDILPHLSSKQYALAETVETGFWAFLEHHIYLLALAGFALYFGLSGVARAIRKESASTMGQSRPHMVVYVLIFALALYCFVVAFVIGEQPDHRYEPVIIFSVAMAVHMAGVDHTVRSLYPAHYDRLFRYLLAGATFSGWLLGAVTTIPDIYFALVFSFVVGAIIILAFQYELPVVQDGRRYVLFVAGIAGFSMLLLLYEALAKVDLSS